MRRQQGLPPHLPQGYERPANIDVLLAAARDRQKPPTVPEKMPAAPEPVLDGNYIRLPDTSPAADIAADTLEGALASLKQELSDFGTSLAGEGNIDKRVTAYFVQLADRIPTTAPSQEELFRLGHAQDGLSGYAKTVSEEWPAFLTSRYLALNLHFDRVLRQFPKWREFKRNAAKDLLTGVQLAAAAPISHDAAASLSSEAAMPFVDPRIAKELEALAATLQQSGQGDAAADPVAAGKELLVEDIVESINNTLKPVAEAALAGGAAAKEVVQEYAKGLAEGLKSAARKHGPKDGEAIFKWARRFLIGGGGGVAAGAFIQRLIQVFPEKFAWLDAVIKFLMP